MRKVLTFLGAALCLAWVGPASAQQAPDMFKDVPTDHWAYQAVENLRSKGILIGYPDQYFRGKRTLTRYEFAVALDRLLQQIGSGTQGPQGEPGPVGPAGPAGPQGEPGPPGIAPEELNTFRRLINEFRDELASLGNNMAAVNRRLDQMGRDIAELRETINRMPKVYGGAFLGIRSDRANGGYTDQDGRVFLNGTGLVGNPAVVHQYLLGVRANIPGGATVDAALTSNNYKNYVGGTLGFVNPGLNIDPPADTYIHHLEISTPFGGLGRDSKLTLGRFGHRISRLTLWKPDVDIYFDNPFEDNGLYYMDGLRLTTNFGSVSVEAFGAKTNSVTGTNGGAWNSPVAGASTTLVPTGFGAGTAQAGTIAFGGFGGIDTAGRQSTFGAAFKPTGQVASGIVLDQMVGVSLGLGVRQLQGGHVRVNALAASNERGNTGNTGFTSVHVLGADADLKIADRITLAGEWSKVNTARGRFNTVNSHDNNAFNATVGYASSGLSLTAGYRYIDPLFYAPGYWGRIGNWINPTNIQGPLVRAAYDLSSSFGLTLGGDFFTGARNRGPAGLTSSDDITRVLVGLRWDVAKNFSTTVDWEGVYYALDNARFGGAGKVHPTEHYITIGTGYNLTSNTLLKLGYQIGDFNGHGALNGGPGTRYNFNSFTSAVAIKF